MKTLETAIKKEMNYYKDQMAELAKYALPRKDCNEEKRKQYYEALYKFNELRRKLNKIMNTEAKILS